MRANPTSHPQYETILAISAAVLAAERDMDNSIVALSKLVTTTIDEFTAAELPGAMSQRALGKLAEAISAHVESRKLLVEAHGEYGRTAKMLGATAEDWGPWWPCTKIKEVKPAREPLRVAA